MSLKVMNAVIHGDHRSRVILSPGLILAGASHVCESMAIMINTVFEEHHDVPPEIALQLDNAAPNHNNCVLAFAGLYCLEGVTEKFRVRFELENHAHEINDTL